MKHVEFRHGLVVVLRLDVIFFQTWHQIPQWNHTPLIPPMADRSLFVGNLCVALE